MKWITRERPKIDRIACPWLIKNFVDPEAEFIYVPKQMVLARAKELGAIPYDIPGAEYSHEGDECTFDFIIRKHGLTDPALRQLALIVRAADTDRFHLAPQAAGLWAYRPGFPTTFRTIRKCWRSACTCIRPSTAGQSTCSLKSIPGIPK